MIFFLRFFTAVVIITLTIKTQEVIGTAKRYRKVVSLVEVAFPGMSSVFLRPPQALAAAGKTPALPASLLLG